MNKKEEEEFQTSIQNNEEMESINYLKMTFMFNDNIEINLLQNCGGCSSCSD